MPKRVSLRNNASKKPTKKTRQAEISLKPVDEEISSSEDELYKADAQIDSEDESEDETAENKRKRMAKEYLAKIANDDNDGEDDDNESDDDNVYNDISSRLKKGRLESMGKFFRSLSSNSEKLLEKGYTIRNFSSGHNDAITCLALSADEKKLFSGSKDNSIICWNVDSGSKVEVRPKWNKSSNSPSKDGEILALAISTDGKYLVSGGRDSVVRVYDCKSDYAEVQAFTGHRDAVTSLAFRRDSYSLFSGSLDRCIKHWDLNEMGYIETMFGHQDAINAIDCWAKEKPVSSSSDRTVRVWKVAEESHLVFRGHKSNVDSVQILTDDNVVSGGQDGSLNLWKDSQKHPILSVACAHGHEDGTNNPRWITSVSAVKMSDLVATGSSDGFVRLWSINSEKRELRETAAVPCEGFVNALILTPNLLIAGTGKEHRLGRWWNLKGNKNKIVVMRFNDSLET